MSSISMRKAAGPAVPLWHGSSVKPELGLDILRYMLFFIRKHNDLLAAMLTCHALHDAGIQPLVQLPSWIDGANIHSFHGFMLAHSPISFLAFREFRVTWIDHLLEDTPLILELLQRGTNLRQLELFCDFFHVNRGVGEAVASLTELEEFFLKGDYSRTDHILARLRSPLTKIEIEFEDNDPPNPIVLLSNLSNTLEQARFRNAAFFHADVCYPKLLELEIQSGRPSLSVLATAFPNLKAINIDSGELSLLRLEQPEQLRALRNRSIAFQDGRECWRSLTSVTANPVALYAMGLKNTLESVSITPLECIDIAPDHLSFLRAALSTTKTRSLSIYMPNTPGILSEAFSDSLQNSVTSLKLTLCIHSTSGVDHENTLNDLFKRLASVSNIMFGLTLDTCRYPLQCAKCPTDANAFSAREFLSRLNEEALVTNIGASMRNVECINLMVQGRGVSYWTNTALGAEKKEWTRVMIRDEFDKFLTQRIGDDRAAR